FYSKLDSYRPILTNLQQQLEERWLAAQNLFNCCSMVVTTNYDPLVYEVAKSTGKEWHYSAAQCKATMDERPWQAAQGQDDMPCIVYLHGSLLKFDQPNLDPHPPNSHRAREQLRDVVLTSSSYAR